MRCLSEKLVMAVSLSLPQIWPQSREQEKESAHACKKHPSLTISFFLLLLFCIPHHFVRGNRAYEIKRKKFLLLATSSLSAVLIIQFSFSCSITFHKMRNKIIQYMRNFSTHYTRVVHELMEINDYSNCFLISLPVDCFFF